MMKQLSVKKCLVVLSITLIGCGQSASEGTPETAVPAHEHTPAEADCVNPSVCTECGEVLSPALGHTVTVGVCERCGELQNEDVITMIKDDIGLLAETGQAVGMDYISVNPYDLNSSYNSFQKADEDNKAFREALEKLKSDCANYEELEYVKYQAQLLLDRTPPESTSADYSAMAYQADQVVNYLSQFTNSVYNITNELYGLYGQQELTGHVVYFDEAPNIPKPDNIMYSINEISENTVSGGKQFFYLAEDATNPKNVFDNYIFALQNMEGLTVSGSGSEYSVMNNGKAAAVIKYGTNEQSGSNMSVTVMN